uniref:Uncharacterized protein n=1 Tax=Panagrolaimus davidi TaxID=227884 RepID=A0A914QIJ5_9BILA
MSSEINLITRESSASMERNNESFLELYKALHRPSNFSVEEEPPSYEAAIEQEKEHQKLIGTFLLKTSHFFGMHPFKAPIVCKNDFCKERGFRDRIYVPDLILCIINLFVIFNHLYLHIWKEEYPEKFLNKTLELILHFLESALPLVCVIGMMFCSYHMHNLLQRLTDAQFRIIQKKCLPKHF